MFNWIVKPSTRAWYREWCAQPDRSATSFLHGYVYARWPYFYIGMLMGSHPLARVLMPVAAVVARLRGRNGVPSAPEDAATAAQAQKRDMARRFADSYHGKVIHMETARKLITVNREIPLQDLEQVIPYETAREIVLSRPASVAVLDCPCRSVSKNPCHPIDVCLIVGEPFVSFILEHLPKKSRRITPEEGIRIVEQAHARGNVQHAFFKDAMLGRFYAICNCCSCCCGAIRAHRAGVPMLASSGYVARVDVDVCKGCGKCARKCQFKAIAARPGSDGKPRSVRIREKRCLGCGVCVDACPEGAIRLEREPSRGVPFEL